MTLTGVDTSSRPLFGKIRSVSEKRSVAPKAPVPGKSLLHHARQGGPDSTEQSPPSRQIEQQHFTVLRALDIQLRLVADRRAVALFELLTIHLNAALGDLQPAVPILPEVVRHFLARLQQRDIQPRVLVDLDRAVFCVGRSNQPKLALLLFRREGLLLVARFERLSSRAESRSGTGAPARSSTGCTRCAGCRARRSCAGRRRAGSPIPCPDCLCARACLRARR